MRKLSAKIGSYEKDGQTKSRWQSLGVIMEKDGGEFLLLDPTVNLGAVLMLQRIEAQKTGHKPGDRVMVSIFSDDDRAERNTAPAQASPHELNDEIPFAPSWR